MIGTGMPISHKSPPLSISRLHKRAPRPRSLSTAREHGVFHRRRITPQKFDWLALEMGLRITGEVEPITTRALVDALFEAA